MSRPARKFIDPLYVDPKEIPAGQDYQWASYEILGDKRGGDFDRMQEMGWRPVPRERHPNNPSEQDDRIITGGLILVERNKVLSDRARKEEREKADAQLWSANANANGGFNPPAIRHFKLPEDQGGIDEGRILPIIDGAPREAYVYTWTDKLTWGLWLSGWRYVPAERHAIWFDATKDPTKTKVLFFDRGKPRFAIERKDNESVRPASDWWRRLVFWK